MRTFHMLLICFFVSGCVTFAEDGEFAERGINEVTGMPLAHETQGETRRFLSLRQVRKGMSRKEVESVLSNKIIVGYEMMDKDRGLYKPITVTNPHHIEHYQKGSKQYQIDHYLVAIKEQDGRVNDDELVPLIFLDDTLVGKGWDLYKKIKK